MELLNLILIALGVSIFIMVVYFIVDIKKFGNKQHLLLVALFVPSVLCAQYQTADNAVIYFRYYENQKNKLEYTDPENNITFRFIPDYTAWGISITNNSAKTIRVDWNNAQFIISGRASGILIENEINSEETNIENISYIKEHASISSRIIPTVLYKKGRIFDNKKARSKNRKISSTIVIPIKIDNHSKKYLTFDFIAELKGMSR